MDENLQKAMTLFQKQDYEGAMNAFNTILAEDSKNAHLMNNIGLCLTNLARFEEAEEYFRKALFVDDRLAQTYINLADVYYRDGKLMEAMELLSGGVTVLPGDTALKHYLARIFIEDKRFVEAIDELDAVLEMSPKNYDANWDLGMVYYELGDYESAISNFEEVLNYVTDNELIFYQTALAYEANDEIDKAISNYLKSISVNDKFPIGYKRLGMLFMARGEKEDAKEYFQDYMNFDIPAEEKEKIQKILDRF